VDFSLITTTITYEVPYGRNLSGAGLSQNNSYKS